MLKKAMTAVALLGACLSASAGVICNSCDYIAGQAATFIGTHDPNAEDNSTFSNATTGTNGDFTNWWVFRIDPAGAASVNAIFLPIANISNFDVDLFAVTSQVCAANTATTGGACASLTAGAQLASGVTNPAYASALDFTSLDAGFYAIRVMGTISGLGPTQPASYTGNLQVQAVPEPASLALAALGLFGIAFTRRRKA